MPAGDFTNGVNRRGGETPDGMANKLRRLEAIRAAKTALEAEAAEPPDPDDENGPGASSGMRRQGQPLRGEDGDPPDRTQQTSPPRTAGPSPRVMASYRATTARSRSTRRIR